MYYVYLIQSIKNSKRTYVGYTTDIQKRIEKHNEGGSVYTAKYKPWKLITYIYFNSKNKALQFETYLKSGSGCAFSKKRFW